MCKYSLKCVRITYLHFSEPHNPKPGLDFKEDDLHNRFIEISIVNRTKKKKNMFNSILNSFFFFR